MFFTGWLEISLTQAGTDGWHERYAALSSRRLLFYNSSQDFVRQKPSRVIKLDKIIAVRNIVTDAAGHISLNEAMQW